jgi:hypothetical protein
MVGFVLEYVYLRAFSISSESMLFSDPSLISLPPRGKFSSGYLFILANIPTSEIVFE